MRKTLAWENIIDEETINLLSEYWGVQNSDVPIPALIQVMWIKFGLDKQTEINFGRALKRHFFRLLNVPIIMRVKSFIKIFGKKAYIKSLSIGIAILFKGFVEKC